MFSPTYSATSPALWISDTDMVIVYDSKGEEFKHQRQAGAIYRSQLSAVVVGSPEVPRQAKFHPAVPRLAAGDVEGVPPLQCGLGTGIKFSGAPTFDHRGLPSQAGGGANGGIDGTGGGASTGEGGSRCGMSGEGGIGAGVEHLSVSGTRASAGDMGLAGASNAVGGVAYGGGGGVGNGTRGWFAAGGVGGSKAEGGLAGQ
ncbi:hypothetical protein E4T56_gene11895 [Termitomyces sp. T112]|nr:hypothetical protein E4T56_gene11895 [Termitomyces sp. T112]